MPIAYTGPAPSAAPFLKQGRFHVGSISSRFLEIGLVLALLIQGAHPARVSPTIHFLLDTSAQQSAILRAAFPYCRRPIITSRSEHQLSLNTICRSVRISENESPLYKIGFFDRPLSGIDRERWIFSVSTATTAPPCRCFETGF